MKLISESDTSREYVSWRGVYYIVTREPFKSALAHIAYTDGSGSATLESRAWETLDDAAAWLEIWLSDDGRIADDCVKTWIATPKPQHEQTSMFTKD